MVRNNTFTLILICFSMFVAGCLSEKQSKSVVQKEFKDGSKRVFVFDNLIRMPLLRNMHYLAQSSDVSGIVSPWSFVVPDQYQEIRTPNVTNNIAWVSPINPKFFMSTKVWKVVQKVVKELSGGKDYFAYDVTVSMLKRLNFITKDVGKWPFFS